jgi:tRNA pseudouridine13 synthase
MKLKRLPEDFQVEEQISLAAGRGPFALYRLTKQSLGTLEAIEAIERKWNLPTRKLDFAGLKDKHAATSQYATLHNGPRRGISQTNLQLDYVGQVERPIHASDIAGNRFQIVARDLTEAESRTAADALAAISRDGLPNYFDSQRFGSLGESGEFIAKPWCLGDYERAVWLAIADSNVRGRPEQRSEKEMLQQSWGRWEACAAKLRPSPVRDIAVHLTRQPGDFKRAITILPHSLRSLWLAAFQSHVWNRILARLIDKEIGEAACDRRSVGPISVPFFAQLNESQRVKLQKLALPLPSARLHLEGSPLQSLYYEVLAAEGLELRQVRVKYPRDTFFSKGERRAIFQPSDLTHAVGPDDLYPGQQKLSLAFTLPRGCYATVLIKRLFGNLPALAGEEEFEE